MLCNRYAILTYLLVFFLLVSLPEYSFSQCISNFPYTEDFEKTDGGWKPGGNASDWAWGTPNKNNILRAGNGVNCWITGTLNGNFYNENEASWLLSPCFDFTNIKLPYLSFQLDWDTEKGYDGAALQYSDDNGISWQSAGAYGDAPSGCNSDNWFNNANIRYGMQQQGWSGSYTNGGSISWVKAYHSFPQLAGKKNVQFRFVFGAGKIQNNYSGFAIDDIYLGESYNDELSFTYTCLQTAREAAFTPYPTGCISQSSLQWNFDDPASGDENIVHGDAVAHPFSKAGIYTVTLTGINNNNETLISSQTIIIPDVTAVVTTPITCGSATGVLQASVTNTNAAASYVWSTDPTITSPSATVKSGFYQVSVSVEGGCSNYANITLTEPAPMQHEVQTTPADCNNQNGSISVVASGGNAPYQYSWSSNVSNTSAAGNLSSGNYTITVTDKNSCVDKADVVLPIALSTLTQTVDRQLPDCGESNGYLKITTSGGDPAYTYQWLPGISNTDAAFNISSGNYTVVATDGKGCRDTASITLANKPLKLSLGNDTTICKGQTLMLRPQNNFTSYLWNDGSTAASREVTKQGNYSITVSNAGGCQASDTIRVYVGCGDLMFPSGFTPNNDGLNEEFGPTGGLSSVSSYRLLVYNRYGNLVFQSNNPYQKWKGDVNDRKAPGTYTFIASYTYNGEKKIKKGTLVLLL